MRAIVTGGAGFIGSHVVDALLARGDEVHLIDNLATGSRDNVPDGATLHVQDIRADLAPLFDEAGPEAVFHLAAQADVGTSVEKPDFDAAVNVVGTVRVLELNLQAIRALLPDRTILLLLDPDVSVQRAGETDRIEREGGDFRRRVDAAYRDLAEMFPRRILTADGTQPAEQLSMLIRGQLRDLS